VNMAKKIRLMDEPDKTTEEGVISKDITMDSETIEKFMKYAEAMDWKLWEILKILRKQTGEEQE